jgi:hypothetical protein
MRRESHRRRGVYRASSGAWGHRAVYIGAVVATAAVIAGFGAALVVYGPIGTPTRQLSGTTIGIPPKGVEFGNAQQALASGLTLTGANGFPQWNWTNATTGNFTGPCQGSGVLADNGSGFYLGANNTTAAVNISAGGGNVTLVCLNSVNNGTLGATWNATNSYNVTNGLPDGSYTNTSLGNISSCNQWVGGLPSPVWNSTHLINNASFAPCATYYQMNNNTSYVTSFGGSYHGGNYTNSTVWAPGEMGYGPNDVVYELPVVFTNASINGTYEISVAIQGVTPVAQTFYFVDTIGGTSAAPDTVLFTFDMTAAWLFDTSVVLNQTGGLVPANFTTALIYGAIGLTSAIITECQGTYCPLAAPEFL